MLPKRIIEEFSLYEGLDITHNSGITVDAMNMWWNLDGRVRFEQKGNKIKMQTRDVIEKDEFDDILKMLNNYGYFPASYIFDWRHIKFNYDDIVKFIGEKYGIEIAFEAKFAPELDSKDIPDIAYHITSTSKEEKILRIGLAPKNKEKLSRHPERIYFTNSLEGAKRLIHNIKFIVNNDKFSIFEVDLKKLHMVRQIRWFPDPNYPGEGFYTYENIPPKYLKVVRRINKTK